MQRLQCVCKHASVLLENHPRGRRMTNWRRKKRKKDFGQVNKNQKKFYTHSSTEDSAVEKRQAATDFCFSLFRKRINGRHLLTLYLSTIGSLTGPSLDLVKFGKLSRWAINGKPLVKKKTEDVPSP